MFLASTFRLAAMASRARNDCDAPRMTKVIRGAVSGIDMKVIAAPDPEIILETYSDLIVDILDVTSRPTRALLAQAVKAAFPHMASGEVSLFANQMTNTVSYCRKKLHNMTSGVRATPHCSDVLQALRLQASTQKLARGAEKIVKGSGHGADDDHEEDASVSSGSLLPISRGASSSFIGGHLGSFSTGASCSFDTGAASSSTEVQKPPAIARSVASSSADIFNMSRADIFSRLGVKDEKPKNFSPLVVDSSPEAVAQSPAIEDRSCENENVATSPEKPLLKASVAFFCPIRNSMVRMTPDGQESASMIPGPNGFLLSQFEGEDQQETDVPNMLMAPGPSASPKKRPAAVMDSDEGPSFPEKPPPSSPGIGQEYQKMIYKQKGIFAIRQKYQPKKQVASAKGEHAETAVDTCIRKLNQGAINESTLKEELQAELTRLRA